MIPSVNARDYQSADEAIKIIEDAKTHGYGLVITRDGDIRARHVSTASEPQGFLQKLLKLFERRPAFAVDESVLVTLVNKMKIEILARECVNENLRASVRNIDHLGKSGDLKELSAAWSNIRSQWKDSPDDATEKISTEAVNAHNLTSVPQSRQGWIDKVNQSLPPPMIFNGKTDSVLTASFRLPDSDHCRLYASLEKSEPDEVPTKIRIAFQDQDPEELEDILAKLARISPQTLHDCGRADFCLKEPGSPAYYLSGDADVGDVALAIESFGASSPGLALETGSRLISQRALGTFYPPLRERIKNRSGQVLQAEKQRFLEPDIEVKPDRILYPRKLKSEFREPKLSKTEYTWTKLPDGSAEFSYLQREKTHFLIDEHGNQVPVNRGPRWEGDVNENNFGYEIRTTIRVSAKDMATGNLKNVVIVEPLTIRFQIAPAEEPSASGGT